MASEIYLILAVLIGGLFLMYILISKKLDRPKDDNTLVEWLKSMQESLSSSNQNLTSTLQRSYRDLHERLDKAATVMGELKREAGAFSEVGRSMRDLQEFLKSPKLRGNIGEEVLKDLITQMFPKNSFFIQHTFKSGNTVDAAIKTDAGILPIDSKFPMENFQRMVKAETEAEKKGYQAAFVRDLRKHVRDISSKYILPDEGTMDFALMYIPSESVYYEVANLPEILEYAREQRVYPVSPTTLYAHLQTILLSFEGHKVEEKSKEVFRILRGIKKDYEKLEENVGVLNKHLTNAYNQMNNTAQTVNTLGQKLSAARSLGSGEENS
jgi:DNA recombination protein RmuC